MDYLPPTLCSDQYTDQLTVGPSFSCDHINIAVGADISDVNAVKYQVAMGRVGDWRWSDEREFTAIPQTFKIGKAIGVRFRNASPGQVATVQAYLLGPKDPDIEPGTPYSQIPKITFEHQDVAVAVAPSVDFEDSATIAWTLTDDAPNSRVKVAAVVQGLTAAMVANAADKSSAATQAFVGAVASIQAAGSFGFYVRENPDTQFRWSTSVEGTFQWGDGTDPPDTQLARSNTETLSLNGLVTQGISLRMGDGAGTIGFIYNYQGQGLRIAHIGNLGFFNQPAIAQPTSTLNSTVYTDLGATVVHTGGLFSGGIGPTQYTIGGIVACLKKLGLIAS